MTKFIITLTGPSCSGKTTIENYLIENNIAKRLCGYTTRAPREGEVDGVDVNFVDYETGERNHHSPDTVQRLKFKGHYYGKTREEITQLLSETDVIVCVIEPSGLKQIEAYVQERCDTIMLPYFVSAPTSELICRMLKRFQDQPSPDLNYYADRLRDLIKIEDDWGKKYDAFREFLMNEFRKDTALNARQIVDDIQALRCAQL